MRRTCDACALHKCIQKRGTQGRRNAAIHRRGRPESSGGSPVVDAECLRVTRLTPVLAVQPSRLSLKGHEPGTGAYVYEFGRNTRGQLGMQNNWNGVDVFDAMPVDVDEATNNTDKA